MALQIWLPLNGTTKNQGLLGELTVSSPTYVDGKLGKAINTGAIKMSAEQTAQVLNNDEVSIAFWVYVNAETGSTTNREMLFGNESVDVNNNRKFSLFQYPTCNDFHWSWMNDTALTTFENGVLIGALPSYKWTHVAVVYKNPTIKVFINGTLKHTATGKVSNSSSFAYDTQVIYNSQYHYFNDYRVYNNAISEKEVHELSKGLVVHYPLNDNFVTSSVNLYDKPYCDGSPSYYTGYTLTKNKDGEGYNFNIEFSGNGNDTWFWIQYPQFSFTDGEMYDYSCKIRINTLNFYLCLRAARNSNDWETNTVWLNNTGGKWIELHTQITIHSSYTFNGTTVTANPLLEFCTSPLNSNGVKYVADFDIKDIQVAPVSENMPVPFSPKEFRSNIMYDTSGFGNNGIVTSGITYSMDSPRNDGCYRFSDTSTISTTLNTAGFAYTYTISYWAKIDDFAYKMAFGFSDGNRLNLYPTTGKFCLNTGDIDSNPFTNASYEAYNDGKWHHYAITGDGDSGIATLYIDGTKIGTAKFRVMNGTKLYISGWGHNDKYKYQWTNGYISDFRLYATVLSDTDIKELYNSPVSITANGTLITQGEFKEE